MYIYDIGIDIAGFTYSARVLNIAGAGIRIGEENNLSFSSPIRII